MRKLLVSLKLIPMHQNSYYIKRLCHLYVKDEQNQSYAALFETLVEMLLNSDQQNLKKIEPTEKESNSAYDMNEKYADF